MAAASIIEGQRRITGAAHYMIITALTSLLLTTRSCHCFPGSQQSVVSHCLNPVSSWHRNIIRDNLCICILIRIYRSDSNSFDNSHTKIHLLLVYVQSELLTWSHQTCDNSISSSVTLSSPPCCHQHLDHGHNWSVTPLAPGLMYRNNSWLRSLILMPHLISQCTY